MKISTMLWAALVPILCAGCDSRRDAGVVAATSSTRAVATAARADLSDLCQRMCDRDVTCAGESAKVTAKELGVDDQGIAQAADKAMQQARENLAGCKQDCEAAAQSGSAAGQAQAQALLQCLKSPGCDLYTECIDKVGIGSAKQ